MAKNKLKRFAENLTFSNLIQPQLKSLLHENYSLKGKWNKNYFSNNNPIVLELGCGKGEYTVNLAEKHPEKNFIGIDYKGARLWRGAKTSHENKLKNVLFIRTKIDMIERFFDANEITEIWITFPDPQPKKERKRLTSPFFINRYKNILSKNGVVHLKTDNLDFFNYTLETIDKYNHRLIHYFNDIHRLPLHNEITTIQTHYEKMFVAQGIKIHYLNFKLNTPEDASSFFKKVYEIVRQIPQGKVTTYGALANYLGAKKSARMVGWAMNHSHNELDPVPAHRVVNRKGVLTGKHHFPGNKVMQQLLENEGVRIKNDQIINFEKYYWDPKENLKI